MTPLDAIDRFCDYFSGQIEAIRDLQLKSDENREPAQYQLRFYRKVLLINAVDTLARFAFQKIVIPNYTNKTERALYVSLRTESAGHLVNTSAFLFSTKGKREKKLGKVVFATSLTRNSPR